MISHRPVTLAYTRPRTSTHWSTLTLHQSHADSGSNIFLQQCLQFNILSYFMGSRGSCSRFLHEGNSLIELEQTNTSCAHRLIFKALRKHTGKHSLVCKFTVFSLMRDGPVFHHSNVIQIFQKLQLVGNQQANVTRQIIQDTTPEKVSSYLSIDCTQWIIKEVNISI